MKMCMAIPCKSCPYYASVLWVVARRRYVVPNVFRVVFIKLSCGFLHVTIGPSDKSPNLHENLFTRCAGL